MTITKTEFLDWWGSDHENVEELTELILELLNKKYKINTQIIIRTAVTDNTKLQEKCYSLGIANENLKKGDLVHLDENGRFAKTKK